MPRPAPPHNARREAKPGALTLAARAEIRAADAGAPAAPRTFRLVANTGEPMRIWPYDLPVVVDLDTVDASGLPIPALYDHCPDIDFVVGTVDAAAADAGGLVASGRFVVTAGDDRNYAAKVLAKADAGYAWQVSIGGDPATVEEVKAGASVVVNGRTYAGPVAVARGVVLREISFVVLGGDRRTSAVVARRNNRKTRSPRIRGGAPVDFETWLLSLGFDDPNALSEIQRANLQQKFDDEYGGEPGAGDDTVAAGTGDDTTTGAGGDDTVAAGAGDDTTTGATGDDPPTNAAAKKPKLTAAAAVAADRQRVKTITRLCTEHGRPKVKAGGRKVDLLAHALESNWSVATVQRHLLDQKRKDRPTGPAVIVKSHDKDCSLQALEGAMILRAGGRLDHPAYTSLRAAGVMANGREKLPGWLKLGVNAEARQRAMEAAHRYSDMSAIDLCAEACRLDGRNPSHGRHATIQAAVSGASLSNVFTTSINAILLSTYMEAEDTTVGWVREQDVADYRLQERPRMLKGSDLKKRPKGAEADHMTRSDSGETYKIAQYAGQFEVDEQDFIDDNLGALSDQPVEMGQAAARLRPDLVYAIILDNPALATTTRDLFNTTDGNRLTGAALTSTTLKAAIKAMQLFRENGKNLNLRPTHLMVPPSLRHAGGELINSATIFKTTGTNATVEFGSKNSLVDENLTLVSDARLENGVTDPDSETAFSGSASDWFVISALAHTIEVGYLRGTGRSPRVRSWKHDKEGKYGMGWDVDLSIGAAPLDWKGFVKNEA